MNMLDSKDTKIIAELKRNGREPIRDIAKSLNLRPSTVHQRIDRLKKSGIIEKFTVKLNNKAVSESLIVYMLVATEKDIDNRAFSSAHIKEVFGITGEYDLLLKMKFTDVEEFNDFLIRFRKEHRLGKTLTMVSTICIKEEI
jgi:DNA-binding Lrp family transcriptional regulator